MRRIREKEVARFTRVAIQRMEDAQHLLRAERNTGAIYLAGYAVECGLKALLLSSAANEAACLKIIASFRGNDGHNLEALKSRYLKQSRVRIPEEVVGHLLYVGIWTTDLRYDPTNFSAREAERFLDSARQVLVWIRRQI